jgi:hypothetical protein
VDTLHNQQFDKSLAHALEQAFVNFAHCLRLGDDYDTQVVYRLIALWFNHYAEAPCEFMHPAAVGGSFSTVIFDAHHPFAAVGC